VTVADPLLWHADGTAHRVRSPPFKVRTETTARRLPSCPVVGRGGSGYPVASASLSRSRPGVGGPAGAPNALNELDALPQACYASGVDATG